MQSELQRLLDSVDGLAGRAAGNPCFVEAREGVRKAIELADVDTQAALVRIRNVMELVVRRAYENQSGHSSGTQPLDGLIQRAAREDVLPKSLEAYAHTIRGLGNLGAHPQDERLGRDDVARALGVLLPILRWFFQQRREDLQTPPPELWLLQPGQAFGPADEYEIVGAWAADSFGQVYKATHRPSGATVALRILSDLAGEADRWLDAARTLAQIPPHPHLVGVHLAGVHAGVRFIELEHVEGEPLTRRIQAGPLPVPEATMIIAQCAQGLAHLHAHGTMHGDVQPANVLLASDGTAKLAHVGLTLRVDFGESSPDAPSVQGSPERLAPEAWLGRPSAATEQYALGATWYELLSGRPMFSGTARELRQQHLEAAAVPLQELNPAVPAAVAALVARLTAKQPEKRFEDWDALLLELRLLQERPESPLQPPLAAPSPPAISSRVPWRFPLLIAAAAALLGLVLDWSGALDRWELTSVDLRFRWAAAPWESSPVRVVFVDQETKDRLSPTAPLSRAEHYARLLGTLADRGVKAIGVDFLVTEPSQGPAKNQEDGELAGVTRDAPAIVHALNLPVGPSTAPSSHAAEVPDQWSLPLPADGLPEASRIEPPIPCLAQEMKGPHRVGHVTFWSDRDGVVRRLPLLIRWQGRVYPSLSLAAAMRALDVARSGVSFDGRVIRLEPAGRPPVEIPVAPDGTMQIDFRGTERIEGLSAWRLLEDASPGTSDAGPWKDAVVFVGSSLDGDPDVAATPWHPAGPLVMAHAAAGDTILRRSFVQTAGALATIALVFSLALLVGLCGAVFRPALAALATATLLAGYLVAAQAAFAAGGRLLPAVAPLLAAVLAYVGATVCRNRVADQDKRLLAGLLGRRLAPAVVARVVRDPLHRLPGGGRKELTILCVEIERFGELSQRVEPEEALELLRGLMETMLDVVLAHGGTLDQVTGQGIRAFFGDPDPQADHAMRAVRSALTLHERTAEVIRRWAAADRPVVCLGCGVATGWVTVGDIGSAQRMEYTVFGAAADAAARLAGYPGGRILVSRRTRTLTHEAVEYEPFHPPEAAETLYVVLGERRTSNER